MPQEKKNTKYTTSDGYSYLTKRTLVNRARNAGKIAAKAAMDTMGFVVTVKDGWVVKEHANGAIEQMHELSKA